MAASAMRKMHVPAYCPCVFGVHAIENSGVVLEVKNVIAIVLMPIMLVLVLPDMSIAAVALAMDIPDMELVGEPDMLMAIVGISMAAMWYLSLLV